MKIIGSGCFGAIYTAYNKAALEKVAIKRVFKEDADDGREAHTQYGLQHENILKLFEFIVIISIRNVFSFGILSSNSMMKFSQDN